MCRFYIYINTIHVNLYSSYYYIYCNIILLCILYSSSYLYSDCTNTPLLVPLLYCFENILYIIHISLYIIMYIS